MEVIPPTNVKITHILDVKTIDLLQECELCHDCFDLQQIFISENGKQLLCHKCKYYE